MSGCSEYQKRLLSICIICLMCFGVFACGKKQDTMEKIKDLECTIIPEENIPEELLAMIEEKKENPFKMTFEDQGFLYICVAMNALYETANAIYVDTNLIGPQPEEKSNIVASYPYVVIKTEFIDKPVVFD